MSKDKKIPPIQPAPVKQFTVRLVDGHFVRVPKLENIARTDATRPASVSLPETSAEGARVPSTMRLVNGRFVRRADLSADVGDATATPAAHAPRTASLKAKPKEGTPAKDTWDAAFVTEIAPADYDD